MTPFVKNQSNMSRHVFLRKSFVTREQPNKDKITPITNKHVRKGWKNCESIRPLILVQHDQPATIKVKFGRNIYILGMYINIFVSGDNQSNWWCTGMYLQTLEKHTLHQIPRPENKKYYLRPSRRSPPLLRQREPSRSCMYKGQNSTTKIGNQRSNTPQQFAAISTHAKKLHIRARPGRMQRASIHAEYSRTARAESREPQNCGRDVAL